MREYLLVDADYKAHSDRMDRIYRCVASIAIKNGKKGRSGYTEEQIERAWTYDDEPPCKGYVRDNIKVSVIKWYIYNEMAFTEGKWNSDFLHGLARNGKISWNKLQFPTLHFWKNRSVLNAIKSSPFGGDLVQRIAWRWKNVPALYLKHSMESIEFMAGVMAGCEQSITKDGIRAKLPVRTESLLKAWGIPFEKRGSGSHYLFLSPIWPALLSPWTPSPQEWKGLNSPDASMIAAVLWRTYAKNDFKPDGIPYLKSRRMTYYKLGEGRGKMKRLEKMRLDLGLTQLDKRMATVIRKWTEGEFNEISTN